MADVHRDWPSNFIRWTPHCLLVVMSTLLALWLTALDHAGAETHYPSPGTVSLESSHSFQELRGRLEEAVEAKDCAAKCEKFDDEVMRRCAEACRRCADECRKMAQAAWSGAFRG